MAIFLCSPYIEPNRTEPREIKDVLENIKGMLVRLWREIHIYTIMHSSFSPFELSEIRYFFSVSFFFAKLKEIRRRLFRIAHKNTNQNKRRCHWKTIHCISFLVFFLYGEFNATAASAAFKTK